MFYLAAIASNMGKVVVLDNLDANIFPNHLALLATAMIQNPQNQYFLSTHDPFLLLDLLDEDSWDHLAVYNVYTKNYQTNVYRLTQADLHDIFYNGVDAFTNNEHFIPISLSFASPATSGAKILALK
jgi:AAA15 family ATPase/GTPase